MTFSEAVKELYDACRESIEATDDYCNAYENCRKLGMSPQDIADVANAAWSDRATSLYDRIANVAA